MTTNYVTIRKKAVDGMRKYTLSLALGLSAIAFGCGGGKEVNLPVHESTRVAVQDSYESHLQRNLNQFYAQNMISTERFDSLFNDSIIDRRLDLNEQKKLLEQAEIMERSDARMRHFANLLGKPVSSSFEGYSDVVSLLRENYSGVDFFKPEMKKKFEKEGLEVAVEKNATSLEIPLRLGGFGLSVVVAGLSLGYFIRRNEK